MFIALSVGKAVFLYKCAMRLAHISRKCYQTEIKALQKTMPARRTYNPEAVNRSTSLAGFFLLIDHVVHNGIENYLHGQAHLTTGDNNGIRP